MRIIDICPQLPFPLVTGGKQSIYYALKSLAKRGHFIHLACLMEGGDGMWVSELEKTFSIHVVASKQKPTVVGALASLTRRTPYQVSRFHEPKLLEDCRELLRTSAFDIVQAEGIHAAYYALALGEEFGIPSVLRIHDVMSLNMARVIRHTRNPAMRLWLAFDVQRVRRYERNAYVRAGISLPVSDAERNVLLKISPGARCDVIPPGIDLDEFAPQGLDEMPNTVLWVGALGHAPNRDSFWWFYKEIVPLVIDRYPDVRIQVAGTGMPEGIQSLRHPNVEVLGLVADIRQAMARAQVCVVPLRIGSGVRIKLLEMFAMGRAVVSTSVGAEGLGVTHDEHLLIADTPEQFAKEVVGLLRDNARRARLGAEARAHVTRQYSWERVADLFEAVYRSLVSDPAKPTKDNLSI